MKFRVLGKNKGRGFKFVEENGRLGQQKIFDDN